MAGNIEEHLSVHERLLRLEHFARLLEDREAANLRRIEQLAARMREVEDALSIAMDRVRTLEHGEDIRDEREADEREAMARGVQPV